MFSSRKVAIALTAVMLLAMLVPAAAAAPEWVHGVDITSPTAAAPVYIDPANPAMDDFKVKFNLTIVGTQVNDVEFRIRAIDANGWVPVWSTQWLVASNALVEGVNAIESLAVTPGWNYGWYAIEVCARDLDTVPTDWFCDVEQKALLIDYDNPGVRLIKPAWEAWISGTDYLMVGKAWDPWWAENDQLRRYGGIAKTWFDYCVISNWQTEQKWCGPTDQSWIKIADGVPTAGVADQYEALWNSTKVPDDWGFIRFCAADMVGRKACDLNKVYVNNRFSIYLRPGWNLISTPLMLNNPDMDAVLLHLIDKGAVKDIYWKDGAMWKKWVAGDASTLEHGKGYWINMKTAATLTFVGAWKSVGPVSPPEYAVAAGWNLIGYTHWGQPTYFMDKTVADYLGMPLAPSVEALWRYDAWSETYVPMYLSNFMVKGAGYWLALSDGGTINP
jgi:hypothetical protein